MKPPIYDRYGVQVHHGDCLDVMRTLPDASVHALVTDPPAGIRFMGRAWDSDMGGRHSWVAWLSERMTEAHRVLKPGGYGLVWALPRTSHWTAWALEDAGFEVRDCIVHLFGSGFPKSHDVGKAIDKHGAASGATADLKRAIGMAVRASGLTRARIDAACGFTMRFDIGYDQDPVGWGVSLPTLEQFEVITDVLGEIPGWPRDRVQGVWRGRAGAAQTSNAAMSGSNYARGRKEAAVTDGARQWDGWGTALKPSQEMWWLIRKPMPGTVAATVLEHGTGALNIGACRVAGDDAPAGRLRHGGGSAISACMSGPLNPNFRPESPAGRFPSNLVLTHAARCDDDGCQPDWCPVAELDAQSGTTTSGSRKAGDHGLMGYMGADVAPMPAIFGDQGGASRFFPQFRWEAKAPASERPMVDGKSHETVKPLGLMRWMVRLVCAPGGTVLDCFAGSGTTGQAARAEGMRAILIEQDADHIDKIRARLDARPKTTATEVKAAVDEPMDLLDLLDGEAS